MASHFAINFESVWDIGEKYLGMDENCSSYSIVVTLLVMVSGLFRTVSRIANLA